MGDAHLHFDWSPGWSAWSAIHFFECADHKVQTEVYSCPMPKQEAGGSPYSCMGDQHHHILALPLLPMQQYPRGCWHTRHRLHIGEKSSMMTVMIRFLQLNQKRLNLILSLVCRRTCCNSKIYMSEEPAGSVLASMY